MNADRGHQPARLPNIWLKELPMVGKVTSRTTQSQLETGFWMIDATNTYFPSHDAIHMHQ